ncbi:MAG: PKD domain-containing protein, partial [Chloroflexi bacterium]
MRDYSIARLFFLAIMIMMLASACNLGASNNEEPEELVITDVPTSQSATSQPTRTVVANAPTSLPVPTTAPFQPLPATSVFLPVATAQLPPQPPTATPLPVSIFILSPIPGNVVSGNVQVIGSATHPQFLQYQLEYGPDPNSANLWYPITGAVQSPIFNGLLGIWNTTVIPDGVYQLRLRVFLRDGTDWGTVVVNGVRVQNRAPTPVPTNTPVIPRPIAAFALSPASGNAPLNVQFTNQSSGQIDTYTWNFGDGTTSNEQSPAHTFTNPGTYNVSLEVTGPGGTSSVSRRIVVNSANPPIAAFTQDKVSGPAPLTVQFANQSTGGQITSYNWNFGDGSTSSEESPSHQFTNVGTYNVILTVSGPGGSDTVTRQITVGNPILASISAVPRSNDSLTLDVSAIVSGGSGTYSSYSWDFGDGQQLLGQSSPATSVTYAAAGTYTITLTVRDTEGNEKTVTQPVTVLPPAPPLAADFSISQATPDDPTVTLVGSATNGSGNYTYAWDFGDGQTSPASADPNATVTYT